MISRPGPQEESVCAADETADDACRSARIAWLARYRRLTIRFARLVAMHRAFLDVGCALICFTFRLRL
jgi:hypothetical protein